MDNGVFQRKNGSIASDKSILSYGNMLKSAFGFQSPAKTKTNMANPVVEVGQQTQPSRTSMDAENVNNIGRELAMDIVYYVSECKKLQRCGSSKYSRTMRRTVDELSERHELLFNGIMHKLKFTRDTTPEIFTSVSDEIFADGKINWGRIVSVYAFAGRLAKYCKDNDMSDYIDSVGHLLGDYIAAEPLSTWILKEGGWDAFEEYFPTPNSTEDKVWRGLLFTMVGLGALATMVAVK